MLLQNISEVVYSIVFNLGNQADCFVKNNWPFQRESSASLSQSFQPAPRADTLVGYPVTDNPKKQVSDTSGTSWQSNNSEEEKLFGVAPVIIVSDM